MKQTLLLVFFSIFLCIVQAQETLEFEDLFPEISVPQKCVAAQPDNIRLKNDVFGKFYVEYVGFNDEQKFAFQYALKLWEEAIPFSKPIYIKVTFNASGSNAYTTSVGIRTNTFEDPQSTVNYPMALNAQKTNIFDNEHQLRSIPDMTINFNKNMDLWDFGTDPNIPLSEEKYDFVTEALRAIAKGLGFGSSSIREENQISFNVRPGTSYIFDSHIKDTSNTYLTSFSPYTSELNTFVKNPLYWDRDNYTDYQLYTSENTFNKYATLTYFSPSSFEDQEKLLMMPQCNGRVHHIGSKILDILEDIGWQRNEELKIYNNEIPESGIVEHQPGRILTFTCTPNPLINNYKWSFDITQKDATFRNISTGTEAIFQIQLPSKYENTDDHISTGAIKGRIHIEATTINNKTLQADYALFINYYPQAPEIEVIDIISTGDYTCDIVLGFGAFGAEFYDIEVIDEDAFSIWDIPVHKSGYVTETLHGIYKSGNYTITVSASNGRGYTNSEPLYFNTDNYPDHSTQKIDVKIQNKISVINMEIINISPYITEVSIIDLNGCVVKSHHKETSISIKDLPKGVYIISAKEQSGRIYNQKIIK